MLRSQYDRYARYVVVAAMTLMSMLHAAAWSQISTDGSLSAGRQLVGPNYQIGQDLGRLSGTNLFHSFQQFSLTAGQTATFSGPASITNIISRITGGQISSIDGRVESTIAGANFFLINPSGLLLGPSAQFDVSGALHLATAQFLRFADGQILSTDLGE